VNRREHEHAAVGGPGGGLRGGVVPRLADHHRIGRLPQHAAQELRRAEVDRVVDRRLPQAFDGVFDRVLDRVNLAVPVVEMSQRGVECDSLARTGRPGEQRHPSGLLEHVAVDVQLPGGHAQAV
jgi:hypothetical protein